MLYCSLSRTVAGQLLPRGRVGFGYETTMKQHKRSGVVAVAVLWAVMAWAVGTKGKADMPTLDWLGREEAVKQDKAVPLRVLREVAELGFAAEGVAPEAASGVLVQGDNLEALRARRSENRLPPNPYDVLKGR